MTKKILTYLPWTCKIILEYHRCPHCGYIIENRQDYKKHDGIEYKEVGCNRCKGTFLIFKSPKK